MANSLNEKQIVGSTRGVDPPSQVTLIAAFVSKSFLLVHGPIWQCRIEWMKITSYLIHSTRRPILYQNEWLSAFTRHCWKIFHRNEILALVLYSNQHELVLLWLLPVCLWHCVQEYRAIKGNQADARHWEYTVANKKSQMD